MNFNDNTNTMYSCKNNQTNWGPYEISEDTDNKSAYLAVEIVLYLFD